jgi:hypothetical protein
MGFALLNRRVFDLLYGRNGSTDASDGERGTDEMIKPGRYRATTCTRKYRKERRERGLHGAR